VNEIIQQEKLSDNVVSMRIKAPLIAEECKAGQFIILSVDDDLSERIPLTIADSDVYNGTITIIFQIVGKTTLILSEFKVGDKIPNLVGPLGKPTEIKKYGRVVCVGGGIGVAPAYPIVKAMKKAGNNVTVIIGARTADLVVYEKEMANISDRLIVCTDDGSYGRKDLVTSPLKEICEAEEADFVIALGPPIMMKFCAETTRPYGIHTVASLNTIMVDGTGMCGGCRVNVGKEVKFVCVDGPEFDAHKVDFDNMINRLNAYKKQEACAFKECKLTRSYTEKDL